MKKRDESKLNLFLHGNSRQVLKEINRMFNANIQEGTLYWREIAEMAEPIGRSDLSVKHHEVLGDLIE